MALPLPSFVSPFPWSNSGTISRNGICPQYFRPSHTRRREGTAHRSERVVPSARVRRGPKPNPEIPESLYEAKPLPDVDLQPFDFSTLKDRVVMVVNVASSDQFTEANYKGFVDLLDKYHAQGFEIVVFPCNWFGQYEWKSHEEIKAFVHETYSDKIKVMAKTNVEWNPVFALAQKYFPGEILWNFHGKFLFGRKGLPVARFDLLTTHEFIDSQVSLYVNSKDDKLHSPVAPEPGTYDEEDVYNSAQDTNESEDSESTPEPGEVTADGNYIQTLGGGYTIDFDENPEDNSDEVDGDDSGEVVSAESEDEPTVTKEVSVAAENDG